jgi:hypothetical protein
MLLLMDRLDAGDEGVNLCCRRRRMDVLVSIDSIVLLPMLLSIELIQLIVSLEMLLLLDRFTCLYSWIE